MTGGSRASRPLSAPGAPPATLGQAADITMCLKEPGRDVGGGRLVATVTDPDDNVLGRLPVGAAPDPAPGVVAPPSIGAPISRPSGFGEAAAVASGYEGRLHLDAQRRNPAMKDTQASAESSAPVFTDEER